MTKHCPAILISAPASGQGKTTVTAALAYYFRQQNYNVRVFKTGPDFIDPQILAFASQNSVYQLDLWMMGETHCRELLYQAACTADIILIEGVMGLFDGESSSAKLAQILGIPIAIVIDAKGMAQTFGALAFGLAHYQSDLLFAGIIANNVGSESHSKLLANSLPENLPLLAVLPKSSEISLPSRHLGLWQAEEIKDLGKCLAISAQLLMQFLPCYLPPAVEFPKIETEPLPKLLAGKKIAVARDEAFSFLYQANLDYLEAMGAQLDFFSPLVDTDLPNVDSIYLCGGYPELHLQTLENNHAMKQVLIKHYQANKPIYAECGGFLYLLETLIDKEGQQGEMVGILKGTARLQKRLVNLGMHSLTLEKGEIRGHSFHHSQLETSLQPFVNSQPQSARKIPEGFYKQGSLQASYLHLYFPFNPQLAASFFL